MPIAKVILDVLKPRELPLTGLVEKLCQLEGVETVSADVIEVDAMTETIKLTIEGSAIDLERVADELDSVGCALRSVDTVVARSFKSAQR
jgi:hypothetical protein